MMQLGFLGAVVRVLEQGEGSFLLGLGLKWGVNVLSKENESRVFRCLRRNEKQGYLERGLLFHREKIGFGACEGKRPILCW